MAKGARMAERAAVQSTRAILMRTHPLTDSSLIVTWLTESHGLVRTVAKGARRPKSTFAGRLDLFFGGEIEFQQARRGDLHALREVWIRDWREGLRKSYASLLLAGYWCGVLGRVLEPGHPEPAMYDLLVRGLDHVESMGASRRALLHFERELVGLMGLGSDSRVAAETLRDVVGSLADVREDLWGRLSDFQDFSSSG